MTKAAKREQERIRELYLKKRQGKAEAPAREQKRGREMAPV